MQILKYTLAWLLIILAAPFLKEILYARSMQIIREMHPYKTASRTQVMQIFSVLGDGDPYFYFAALCLLFDNIYDFCYLTTSLFVSSFWVNILKIWFQDSRP